MAEVEVPKEKEKEQVASHGIRMRNEDWTAWQEIVGAYPSAADAFKDVMALAKIRAMGVQAGMMAKADLVLEHTRQIAAIYTDLLHTMDDQGKIAAGKLAEVEQKYESQLRAARDAESKARSEAQDAKEEAETALRSRDGARKERDMLIHDLEEVKKEREISNQLAGTAAADAASAREELKALRANSKLAQVEISELREQLAAAQASNAELATASKLAETKVDSLMAQLESKDELIASLRDQVVMLKSSVSSTTESDGSPDPKMSML